MENLPILSSKPTPRISKWILGLILAVSFIGFLDAAYLTIEHYNKGILRCYVFEGCDEVTSSKYSTVGGIPIALFGAVYYLAIFIATILFIDTKYRLLFYVLTFIPILGFLFSAWFVYLQLAVIKAICLYCMISAATSTSLFVLGLAAAFKAQAREAADQKLS